MIVNDQPIPFKTEMKGKTFVYRYKENIINTLFTSDHIPSVPSCKRAGGGEQQHTELPSERLYRGKGVVKISLIIGGEYTEFPAELLCLVWSVCNRKAERLAGTPGISQK